MLLKKEEIFKTIIAKILKLKEISEFDIKEFQHTYDLFTDNFGYEQMSCTTCNEPNAYVTHEYYERNVQIGKYIIKLKIKRVACKKCLERMENKNRIIRLDQPNNITHALMPPDLIPYVRYLQAQIHAILCDEKNTILYQSTPIEAYNYLQKIIKEVDLTFKEINLKPKNKLIDIITKFLIINRNFKTYLQNRPQGIYDHSLSIGNTT